MPQPEEFFEENDTMLNQHDSIQEDLDDEELDDDATDFEDDFEDDSEDDFEDDSEDDSEEELMEDDDDEEMSEEYEVIATSDTNTDFGGGKIKKFPNPDDKSAANKATIASKRAFVGKAKIPDKSDFTMKEHMTAMFADEDLTEDFKIKAAAVFEAAISERYDIIVDRLEEAYATTIQENTEKILDELASRVNDYVTYIAEEWMNDNRLVVENGIKNEIAENFLVGIRDIFEQNYIQVPEEKVDLMGELSDENDGLRNEVNEHVNKNMELRKEILALRCNDIFESQCSGLADTQSEKLRVLAEGIEFDSEELFEEKLSILKESYFGNSRRVKNAVPASAGLLEETIFDTGDNEDNLNEEVQQINPIMQNYASALSRKGLTNR